MQKLSHTNKQGKALMVDVSSKPDQQRVAIAEGFITLEPETLELIRENNMKKGDVIAVARIAGMQAAKETSHLIPLCHPLPIHHIHIEEKIEKTGIQIRAEAKTSGKTGVEMEALTAVSISLLTIYDMCKAVDKRMVIGSIRLVEKRKG
jgi:cyclic pyranopterin phosphate synthase